MNLENLRDETVEAFEAELPASLRDVARRGLAWLETNGWAVLKLNSVAEAWLARFFPPGVCGSCLPKPLLSILGAWGNGPLRSGTLWVGHTQSASGRLTVRAFYDPGWRGVLLVLDLLPPFAGRFSPRGLTEREAEVLRWVARGKTDPEIAIILGTRPRTIEKHVEHILAKLGVENRTTAALMAIEGEL
jgi:Response regulator containing a CheY-like receiver domain and an HTH DNA-binding domain